MARPANRRLLSARSYAQAAGPALEKADATAYRTCLLAGQAGQVIEICVGNGLNFPHYPPEVKRLLAVEPEPRLRALDAHTARTAPIDIQVADAGANSSRPLTPCLTWLWSA